MASNTLTTSAADFLPSQKNLASLRRAAEGCRGCPLYADATQAVFGEGPDSARVMMVGEQPGDQEDRQGRPFVGPAGRMLDEILAEVGIPREKVYLTNAVKHFKWTPRGKRRIHAKPTVREVRACRPWLEAELAALRPPILVCLGATAAQDLLGSDFKLTERRGTPFASDWAEWTLATYHPSAVLRAQQVEGGEELRQAFTADLELVARKLRG
jgi:uracil-DNA glycosylase family protein